MKYLIPLLILAGCATPTADLPPGGGMVCVSTLTTTVVTMTFGASTIKVASNCNVQVDGPAAPK
jgi:hypothetical protein